MAKKQQAPRFLLCVDNEAYPVSLEKRKIYRALLDPVAAAKNFVRVIDESGEDYLYPAKYFVAIDLPKIAAAIFVEAS
jgi:hypothetical protein